jgi:hypothetical protein
MSVEDQIREDKKMQRKLKDINLKLDKFGIKSISDHLITSHIKNIWSDEIKDYKENLKNVVKQIIIERISQRRRNILTHACIYYRFDTNVLNDHEYDNMVNDLKVLQTKFPKLSEQATLHSVFKDWHTQETTSGFDLPINNPKVIERALKVIKLSEWYKSN